MNPADLELHDATLDAMNVDHEGASVTLNVSAYLHPDSSDRRVPVEILFTGVHHLNQISDLDELADNRTAGNIVYWNPATGSGTTAIYLTGGLLAITADSVEVRSLNPGN